MAVQLVTKINRYIGTAAEIAALTLTGIPVGSTFFEADTGILKTLSAAGTLVVAPSETVALAAGTALAGKFVPVDADGDEKFTAGNPGNTSDITLQSSAAAILGKIIAAPSTEAKQDALITAIRDIERVAADNGIATSGENNTLTDSVKNWGVNAFAGSVVIITTGTGAGQLRQIASNTATQLTISPNWTTNPNNTSQYEIRFAGKLASDVTHIGGKAQSAIDIAAKIDAIHAAFITNKNAGVQLSGSKVTEGIADFVLNKEGTLLASAARTTTAYSPTVTNYNAKGMLVTLDVTAASGTGGLVLKIRYVDPVTGKHVILNSDPSTITATGITAYALYPGVSGTAAATFNVKQFTSMALPRNFQVYIYHMDDSSYTYSVGYSLIL